jgi:hypothetical protein
MHTQRYQVTCIVVSKLKNEIHAGAGWVVDDNNESGFIIVTVVFQAAQAK